MMGMIEQLVSRVFYDRNFAHLEHWKTDSYAQHQAFGGFYESVILEIDKLIEAYQGLSGKIGEVKDHKPTISNPTALRCIVDTAKWIAENRSKICENVEALENIRSEEHTS